MTPRTDEFVIDAREHIHVVEQALLWLEKRAATAADRPEIDRCFRAVHAIKGDAGFLGYSNIHALAHTIETVLDQWRQIPSRRTAQALDSLLAARDCLAALLDDAEHSDATQIHDLLRQLEFHRIHPSPSMTAATVWIDLSALGQDPHFRLADYLDDLANRNPAAEFTLDVGPSDLTQRLPEGPVRLSMTSHSAVLSTQRESIADAADMQVGVAHSGPTHQAVLQKYRLKVDLRTHARSHESLGGFLLRLRRYGQIAHGAIDMGPTDLRQQLPVGPVIFQAEYSSRFARARLLSELGLASSELLAVGSHPSDTSEPLVRVSGVDRPSDISAPATPASVAIRGEPEKATTLRIGVDLIDRLMNLVGELTLVRNQALQAFGEQDRRQQAIIQRLNSVTSELQDSVLRTRMQPVGNLFAKFPRMVRDLARQLGKQVEITLDGREVELDKTVLEQLSDPLTHLIRNSIDHGIERPDERAAQGKPGTGRITVTATHEDGQVHIEIRDDGRGIDTQAVRAKALAVGLKTESELDRMAPRELVNLVLLPGFSTAAAVTDVSGRGVGLDIVRTNLEQLEGSLNIDSRNGAGTSMILRVPLTLAIIPCLIVTADGNRYGIPQRELEEVVCLHPQLPGHIERAFDTEVYRLRDRLLPIARFREVLARRQPFTAADKADVLAKYAAARDASDSAFEYLVILRSGSQRFGLLVDEVRGTEEIVIKPMHPSMKRLGIFAGATILGDGRVALIADVEGIAAHAQLSFETRLTSPTSARRDAAEVHRVLLFEYGSQERYALPLLQIRRIESVETDRIERVGDWEYLTVDGTATRIMRIDQMLDVSPAPPQKQMFLILPKFVPQPVGLLISRIVDTESLSMELQQHHEQRGGIVGSSIIRGRMTLFLDIHSLCEQLLDPNARSTAPARATSPGQRRVLLVDDTAFFREVVKRHLEKEGYHVQTAIHGADGIRRVTDEPFDLIISDIEMPVMDGWTFAQEVRQRGYRTRMLALTSLNGPEYEARAQACGYDGYEVKLDQRRLVQRVRDLVSGVQT